MKSKPKTGKKPATVNTKGGTNLNGGKKGIMKMGGKTKGKMC